MLMSNLKITPKEDKLSLLWIFHFPPYGYYQRSAYFSLKGGRFKQEEDHAFSPYFLVGKLVCLFCTLTICLLFWWWVSCLLKARVSLVLRKRARLVEPLCRDPATVDRSFWLRMVRLRAMFLRTPLILASLEALPEEAFAFLRLRSSSFSLSMLARMVWTSLSLIFLLTCFSTIYLIIFNQLLFYLLIIYAPSLICYHRSTMGRIFKVGRVVVFTQGRFAGKKAVVIKAYEEGNKKHRFPHLLVAGIARHIPQVKRTDSKKKFIKKTSVKPFVKYVNQNHVLPTRFLVNEFDLKDVKDDNLKTKEAREALRKNIREAFSNSLRNLPNPKENEKAGHTKFFFSRLRF